MSFILSLVLLAVPCLALAVAPAEEPALAKSLDWLVAHQKEDGSFSQPNFPGLTALALWGLADAKDPKYKPSVDKAVDYILSLRQEDGGIYKRLGDRRGGSLSTYNTAICLAALSVTDRKDAVPAMLAARSFLANSQEMRDSVHKGGFGYNPPAPDRAYSDLSNTHFVLEAMRMTEHLEDLRPSAEKKADLDWDAALAYLDSLQCKDESKADDLGGFIYSAADPKAAARPAPPSDGQKPAQPRSPVFRSYGSITYAGLMGMLHCKLERTDPRVLSALDWAGRHWSLDENPGQGTKGLYYFYDVLGRALRATQLDEIKRPDGTKIDWRAELKAKLKSLQKEDGHWVNDNGRYWENDPVLTTAFAVLAYEAAL